jgi:hypothetical protein
MEPMDKLNKVQAQAFSEISDTQLSAMKIIARNFERGMSTKAMTTDGEEHFKCMWLSLGAFMFMDELIKARKLLDGRYTKEAKKKEAEEIKEEMDKGKGTLLSHYQRT